MPPAARALLFASAAISIIAAAAAANYDPDREYITRLQKGDDPMYRTFRPFAIPDGECFWKVDNMLFCPGRKSQRAVRVGVEDYNSYPVISISNDLQHGSIRRAQPCTGEAIVRIQMNCPAPYYPS